jgi:heme O synthase-like polyprenyltransferase
LKAARITRTSPRAISALSTEIGEAHKSRTGTENARIAGAVAPARSRLARIGDFVALMKPRVMSLVVFTALCGLFPAIAKAVRRRQERNAVAARPGAWSSLGLHSAP